MPAKWLMVAVHAAVAHQAQQMQAGRNGLGKCGFQYGVLTHRAVLDGIIHAAKILIHHAPRTQIQVTYFGIAHLPVGKAHVFPGSAQQAVGIVGKEVISKRVSARTVASPYSFATSGPNGLAAPAVANDKNDRLFRHAPYLQAFPSLKSLKSGIPSPPLK